MCVCICVCVHMACIYVSVCMSLAVFLAGSGGKWSRREKSVVDFWWTHVPTVFPSLPFLCSAVGQQSPEGREGTQALADVFYNGHWSRHLPIMHTY